MVDKLKHINYPIVAKSHTSMYLMHKYWARKPHNVVAEYIKVYSKPNDIVLDPFSGSGVTAIESLKLKRKAIAIDLDPLANFIARCTLLPLDLKEFSRVFQKIGKKTKETINTLYLTKCVKCKKEVIAEAIIWGKDTPKEIRYSCDCENGTQWKEMTKDDYKILKKIEKRDIPYWYPQNELIWNTRVNVHKGTRVSDLFTRRNLIALSMIYHELEAIRDKTIKELMQFTFSSALPQASKMVFIIKQRGRKSGKTVEEKKEVGSWATRGYWVPSEYFEINAWNCFEERFKKIVRGKEESNKLIEIYNEGKEFSDLDNKANILFLTRSSLDLSNIPSNSVDYIFTDPPYGDSVPYLELDYMWNSWLKFSVNFEDEIIISNSPVRNKNFELYDKMLKVAFREVFRVLKSGKYLTVTFHNTDIKVWKSIISAVTYGGFDLEKITYQPPARPSAKGLLHPYASAVGDYYIRFRKPKSVKPKTEEEVSEDRYKKVVLESAKKILAERGEPTPYTYILNGIYVELKKEGVFLTGATNVDEVMKEFLCKEFTLINVIDEKGKLIGQKWWFLDPTNIPYLELVPLADRVETAIVDVLRRKVKISFDDVLQEIFIKFPNALTPEPYDIKTLLKEYAKPTKDGKWLLKPSVKQRESEHSKMIYYLAIIGEKLGCRIWIGSKEQGQVFEGKRLTELCNFKIKDLHDLTREQLKRIENIDLLWCKGSKIISEFEIENTTSITESIIRGSHIPYDINRYIVIPDERADLLKRKIKEPVLEDRIIDENWKFIYYTKLEEFFSWIKRKKELNINSFKAIVSNKIASDETGQIKLFDEDT
jgi:16S rRNA G966 N2-methylase RsmD